MNYNKIFGQLFEIFGAFMFEFIVWAPFTTDYNNIGIAFIQLCIIVQAFSEINTLQNYYIKYVYALIFYVALLGLNTSMYANACIAFAMFCSHKYEHIRQLLMIGISIFGVVYYNTILIGVIGRLVIEYLIPSKMRLAVAFEEDEARR